MAGSIFDGPTDEVMKMVPISKVEPNREQPRSTFDETALQTLAESIENHGLLQPLTVRELDRGYYQIIAGERRWRAARMAGLQKVPVRVIEADDQLVQEMALVENLQREDLSPIEEALGYKRLESKYNMSIADIARAVGKDRSSVANMMRLLALPDEIQEMLSAGVLTTGHARALLPLPTDEVKITIANQVISKGLSVRQVETLVAAMLKAPKAKAATRSEIDYADLAGQELSSKLGRKVTIVEGLKKGHIELEYYGADDREALLKMLASLGS